MEAFNKVRNDQSFANDNPVLNYSESVLIFNSVTSTIKFIETVENKIEKNKEPEIVDWENWSI